MQVHNLAAGDQDILKIIDIDALINQALHNIYNRAGEKQPLIEKVLFDISNKTLQRGIDTSFRGAGVVFGKENALFISEFKTNAKVFSAFKNHQQTNEIVGALTDSEGKLRSFSQFKKEALMISQDYNKTWLQTEYNTAVRSARMAANWKKFQETAELYPNLEYMPSVSANPRDAHRILWHTIRPIDDPFWNIYMPPSDWNCKCSIRAVNIPLTPIPEDAPYIKPEFRNNPGKTAEFINLKLSPYYLNTEPGAIYKINEYVRSEQEGVILPGSINLSSQRKEILHWAKENLLGESIIIEGMDKKVTFSNAGFKEAVNQPHKHLIAKNEAIRKIVHLLKSGTYIRSDADIKGNTNILYHYIKIEVNGEDSFIVLKESLKEGTVVFYSIVDKIRK